MTLLFLSFHQWGSSSLSNSERYTARCHSVKLSESFVNSIAVHTNRTKKKTKKKQKIKKKVLRYIQQKKKQKIQKKKKKKYVSTKKTSCLLHCENT